MEKDKGIFSFRKHPVGELPDGKKERKRKESRLRGANARKMRRALGMLLAAAFVFNTLLASGLAVSASEQETGLCEHHRSHTAECGYAEEDNTPCGYECRICPIEDLIVALPEQVTADNAADVRTQLDEIFDLYRELTEDEQEQIDISHCLEHTFTVAQSGTQFVDDGVEKTYKSEMETKDFTAGDTITVKATPAAAGTAPQKAAVDADAAGTVDVNISAVAKVDMDGTTTYLDQDGFIGAFQDNRYNGATITLLDDVAKNADTLIEINCTLDLGGHTLSGGQNYVLGVYNGNTMTIRGSGEISDIYHSALSINRGTVILEGGRFCSSGENASAIAVDSWGNLCVTGSDVVIENTGGGYGLSIGSLYEGCSVQLSAGTYSSPNGAIYIWPKYSESELDVTLPDLLGHTGDTRYAYYNGETPITGKLAEKTLTGTVTVEECSHTGEGVCSYTHIENTSTHTTICLACGQSWDGEDCTYGEYTYNDTSHTQICTLCGYEKTEAHTIQCTATASGTVIAVRGACETCGYGAGLGTVSFTFENLVYGASEAKVSWTKDGSAASGVVLKIDNADDYAIQSENTAYSYSLTKLFGDTPVTVGDHTLKVLFYDDSIIGGKTVECELPFKIAPASLTDSMVTLSAESVTYNGAEQKPTVTVSGLTENTDYTVTFDRDDFTNAGTVNINVTGTGNYTGTVTKTFTIGKATLAITWSSISQELTYTGDPAAITAPTVTLVNGENFSGAVSCSYKKQGETDYKDGLPTDAGTYTVRAHVDAVGNYAAADSTNELALTIYKSAPAIAFVSDYTLNKEYDGQTIAAPSAADAVTVTGVGNGDVTFQWSDIPLNAGTYTLTATIPETANTEKAEAVLPVTISSRMVTPTITINPGSYKYTGGAINPSGSAVRVMDGTTVIPDSEYTLSYGENIQAGTGSVTVTDKENGNYTIVQATETFTITKANQAALTITGVPGSVTYGDIFQLGVSGGSGTGSVSWAASGATVDDVGNVTITRAGMVVITPIKEGDSNYFGTEARIMLDVSKKALTVSGADARERAYDRTNKVAITAVTIDGIVGSDTVAVDVSGIQGTLSSANAGMYTAVTLPQLTLTGADSENYTLVQPQTPVSTSVEITPLDAVITVGTDTYHKTFGDAAFTLDVTDNNPEADVRYEVTEGVDVVSVENSTVTILNAGTAELKVSLPASANYTAAESKTITVTVDKKSGYTAAALNRDYFYQEGGTGSIDLAALLPKDCGNVTYGEPAVLGNVTYSADPAVSGGKLSYTLNSGNVNEEGTITVTVATQNYEDITVTVNVKLTDQIPVSLKTGTEVTLKNNVLTYGEPLSNLVFHDAEFAGTDGKTVTGTLAWKEASATPDAGTVSAVWIFTPAEDKYTSLEGTAAITVNKAVPTVSAVPTVAERIYNPSVTLKGEDLTSVTVTGVDGNTLKGTWNWQNADIVPTVTGSGYEAIFTPENATNYETVTRTITVNVTKATPYIAKSPVAAGITYGDTLNASALSGGTVLYGNGRGQEGSNDGNTATVAGSFTWKEPFTKPVAADSNVTEYTVVFTPSDTANYNPVETKVTLTVNKAQNAPNMPGSAMDDTRKPGDGTAKPGTGRPGDAEPGSGSTEETRPDTGIPFIKGEDGKNGWDVIRAEEEKAEEGSIINVDMNGTTVVPGDIFDSIKGKDITITFDMGSGILWSVDGKSITTDKAGDIDFSVKTETNAIPVDIVNNVTGERYSIQISLANEGEFGFTAVLSIGLGRENAGYTASLYYYNTSTGELEFICSGDVAEDGTVSLAFTHASDYVIAIDGDEEEENGTIEAPKTDDESTLADTANTGMKDGVWNWIWVTVVCGVPVIAGLGIFLVGKRKKEE